MSDQAALSAFCSAEAAVCASGAVEMATLGCGYWTAAAGLSSAQVGLQGAVAASAILLCALYAYLHIRAGFRHWLVTYYTAVVAAQYLWAATAPRQPPAFLYLPCAAPVNWLRYASWILIAPAILITLLRTPSLDLRGAGYPRLLEPILILHLLTVVLGTTAAFSADMGAKAAIFAVATAFGLGGVLCTVVAYLQHYAALNNQQCRAPLLISAALFYVVWIMYPVLFIAGPEGFGNLSPAASDIAYAVVDLVKLAWGLAIWRLDSLCRVLGAKYETVEKQVVLPLGLGTLPMYVFGSRELESGKGGTNGVMASGDDKDGEDEDILVPPVALARQAEAEKLMVDNSFSGGRTSQSSQGSKGRLSIDVKQRLMEIERKSRDSDRGSMASDPGPDGRGRLSIDMRRRVEDIMEKEGPSWMLDQSPHSKQAWKITGDDANPYATQPAVHRDGEADMHSNRSADMHSNRSAGSKGSGNRLSLDVAKRLDGIQKERNPDDIPSSHDDSVRSGGRLSIDVANRVDNLSKNKSSFSGSESNRGASIDSHVESFTSSLSSMSLHGSTNAMQISAAEKLPWETGDSSTAIKGKVVKARRNTFTEKDIKEASEKPGPSRGQGSTVRRLTSRSTKKDSESKLAFSKQKSPGKLGPALDWGPAPVPTQFPVKLLVATQSEETLDSILDQLLDSSSERPVKIVATADVADLNNLITHLRKEGSRSLFEIALVHSSLVASPLTQALRSNYNVRIVAFGNRLDHTLKREEYDDWLASNESYIPNRGMDPFNEMELLRIMSFALHQKNAGNPAVA